MTLATMADALASGFEQIGSTRCVKHENFPGVLFAVLTTDDDTGALAGRCHIDGAFMVWGTGAYRDIMSISAHTLTCGWEDRDAVPSRVHNTETFAVETGPGPDGSISVLSGVSASTAYRGTTSYPGVQQLPFLGVLMGAADAVGYSGISSPAWAGIENGTWMRGSVLSFSSAMSLSPRVRRQDVDTIVDRALVHTAGGLHPSLRLDWLVAARDFVGANVGNPKLRPSLSSLVYAGNQWLDNLAFGGLRMWRHTNIVQTNYVPPAPIRPYAKPIPENVPSLVMSSGTLHVCGRGPIELSRSRMSEAEKGSYSTLMLAASSFPSGGSTYSNAMGTSGSFQESEITSVRETLGAAEPKRDLRTAPL